MPLESFGEPRGMGSSMLSPQLLLLPCRRFLPFLWLSPQNTPCFSSFSAAATSVPPRDRAPSRYHRIPGGRAAGRKPVLSAPVGSFGRENLVRALDSTPHTYSATGVPPRAPSPKGFQFQAMPEAKARVALRPDLAGEMRRMEDCPGVIMAAYHPSSEGALGSHPFRGEGRLPHAMSIFKAACSEGRCPSISTCNALLGALVAEGSDLESVVFVYKEMVKGGIAPDVETLNCLMEALFQASRADSAMAQFRRMKTKGCVPNSRTFDIVMRNLCVNGRVDESAKVLDEMLECGFQPPDGDFFSSIIPMFCTFNRFLEAMKLFQFMRVVGVSPDLSVYSALICCLCGNGELDAATHLLEEMSERGLAPGTNVYVSLVNGFSKLGKFDEALILLNKNGILEVEPYNALLQGYCREGRFLIASNLLKKMSENGVSDELSWNILIRALGESQYIRKASEVLSRMVVSGCQPDEVTFSAVISGHCLAGAYENALEYFQHVRTKSWSLDSDSCSNLIHGLCHVRKVQEATKIFYYISDKGHNLPTSSLNLLISHICSNGFVSEAIKMQSISFCNGSPPSSVTFDIIILALLELNKAKNVRVLLSQMLVEDCPPDVKTYCILIHGLCTANMTRDAVLLFDQMIYNGLIPSSGLVDSLLSHLAKCSQVHEVAQNLEKLIEQGLLLDAMIYNRIICALLSEGHNHEASKFLDQMLEKGWVPDAETHGLLVGNVGGEEEHKSLGTLKVATNDNVANILAEGLSN